MKQTTIRHRIRLTFCSLGALPILAAAASAATITYPAGTKVVHGTNGSVAGINVGSVAGNPITLANGDLWYNSSTGKLMARIAGSSVDLGAGGGGGGSAAWGDITGTLSDQTDLQSALDGRQPLDSDLTAIAALTTTSYGRGFLTQADAAATKTALSLGNVENTALSTWAGSSSITTLGTVTSGTFSGTLGAISGSALTNLNGSNISSGTVALARLPATTGGGAALDSGYLPTYGAGGELTATESVTIYNSTLLGSAAISAENITSGARLLYLPDSNGTLATQEWVTSTVTGTKTLARWYPTDYEAPSTAYATLDARGAGLHPVLEFDTTTSEAAVFRTVIPEGTSLTSGVTVYVQWTAESATSGTIGWTVKFERVASGGIDIDAESWGTARTITAATVPGTSGVTSVTSVSFSQAQLPSSLAAGDMVRVCIARDTASDNASGDAQILMVEMQRQ